MAALLLLASLSSVAGFGSMPGETKTWDFMVAMVFNDDTCTSLYTDFLAGYQEYGAPTSDELGGATVVPMSVPIGECTKNVVGNTVIFGCDEATGIAYEKVYADVTGLSPQCKTE